MFAGAFPNLFVVLLFSFITHEFYFQGLATDLAFL